MLESKETSTKSAIINNDPQIRQTPVTPCVKLLALIQELTQTRWSLLKSSKNINSALKHVVNFFGGDTSVCTITNRQVHDFISRELSEGIKPATINRHLSALKVLIKHARIMGYTNEIIEISQLKENNRRMLTITQHEYANIIEQLCDLDMRDIFIVLYATGLRLSELLRLEQNDINPNKGKYGYLTVNVSKNNKPRTIPMTEAAKNVITSRLGEEGKLFRYTKNEVYAKWTRMKQCLHGLDYLVNNPEFVPHILRHSCLTNLATRGVPITHIQQWAGHTTITTTARYMHLTDNQLEQYIE
ncbi:MAG: tyrosine-type recombinase/integrase [Synergistaceae bacterium]|jgi:integrase|nr:tyrosine-type recombinase/integrase [Synergistaceae bacterium]